MPREVFGPGHPFLDRAQILTFEEIERLTRLFVAFGATKLRLTGGEPLLRRQLPELVRRLAALGAPDLALTTNGSLLAEQAAPLAAAGLRRVTVSLDSLDDAVFRRMNDAGFPVARVLDGIDAAAAAGLAPIKLNCVVRRGVNEESIVPLVERFRGTGHLVRFIEYMDVGESNRWRRDDVVPAREILDRVAARWPLEPLEPGYRGEVARRWRFTDGGGEIGVVASVTAPFCGDCTRARLSADGRLFTCLFATAGTDLRGPLRAGADDAELAGRIAAAWGRREDRYSELRALVVVPDHTSHPSDQSDPSDPSHPSQRVEMSYIGG